MNVDEHTDFVISIVTEMIRSVRFIITARNPSKNRKIMIIIEDYNYSVLMKY
jgi:hypothetical protein